MTFKEFIERLLCSHKWEKINEFVTESELEVIKRNGYKPNTSMNMTKKYVTDYCCENCGKLRRFIVRNK